MKILHVMAGGKHGGAETACIDMVLAMHEAGQDVALVTRDNPRNERLKAAGITVYSLPFGGVIDIYTRFALTRIIKRFKPDIVQSWMSRASAKTPRWRGSMGIPAYKVVSRLGGYYSLKYFKNTDFFTTITPLIKTYLEENGVAPDNVRHINNFAETEAADARPPVRLKIFRRAPRCCWVWAAFINPRRLIFWRARGGIARCVCVDRRGSPARADRGSFNR
ncbi:MAG: glycosyltransferase [Alphaproteobacteria bacterium]|nr:glycosyltransferase [Alphaproteobacteria bacterium]